MADWPLTIRADSKSSAILNQSAILNPQSSILNSQSAMNPQSPIISPSIDNLQSSIQIVTLQSSICNVVDVVGGTGLEPVTAGV
jgi:hypothetical protein